MLDMHLQIMSQDVTTIVLRICQYMSIYVYVSPITRPLLVLGSESLCSANQNPGNTFPSFVCAWEARPNDI